MEKNPLNIDKCQVIYFTCSNLIRLFIIIKSIVKLLEPMLLKILVFILKIILALN